MTPHDLDMFKVKNTNMQAAYTHEAQIFVCFKVHRMTLKWPICSIHATYTPLPSPLKFSSVSLYDEPFSSYASFFRKSAPNDPKWP